MSDLSIATINYVDSSLARGMQDFAAYFKTRSENSSPLTALDLRFLQLYTLGNIFRRELELERQKLVMPLSISPPSQG